MKKILIKFALPLLFLLFLLTRLLPYINNPVPLGYDAGLYLLNFKTFPLIPAWVQSGFAPGLYSVMYPLFKLGIPYESVIIPLSLLSQIVLFLSFYFVGKKLFNQKTALFILLLFTASSIQFRTFWYYYVNNTFALSFLLCALYFFCKKKFYLSLFFTFLVGLFHFPTFLILMLLVGVEFLFHKNQRLFYVGITGAVLSGLFLYYLPQFKQTIQPFLTPLLQSTLPLRLLTGAETPYGGAFYSLPTFALLTVIYIPLVLYGLYSIKDKLSSVQPFVAGFIVTTLIVISRFSFYKRFLIHLDLFLVFFAGLGFYFLYEKYKANMKIVDLLQFYMLILLVFVFAFIFRTSDPLISKSVFTEIRAFSKVAPINGYILSYYSKEPAWLMGYTDLKVVAPRFGEYDKYWTVPEWTFFFTDVGQDKNTVQEKIRLLKKVPRPLYIFIENPDKIKLEGLIDAGCIEQETPHIVKVKC